MTPLSPLASHALLFGLMFLVLGTAWAADRRQRRSFEEALKEEDAPRLAAVERLPEPYTTHGEAS